MSYYHRGRRGAYYDDCLGEGSTQMPPSSQTSYNADSFPSWEPDDAHYRRSDFERYDRAPSHSPRYSSRSLPRAPRAMRETEHSANPPPPNAPLPEYLALSEQAPSQVDDPALSRKLLILDLNGTLLHRSPHGSRPKPQYRTSTLPRLRPVHPRPYMPAFRSYLFATQTKAWLDVMVWSSAQPHSVNDMVDKCFGEDTERLLAVWARDTLGLTDDHYFRKVQTLKDLAKPWSFLAPKAANYPSPSIASTPNGSPAPSSPTRPSDNSRSQPATDHVSPQTHSALTTLLLDDSPRKAELQPFNHVCIYEYTGEQRSKDLESLQKDEDWKDAIAARESLDSFTAHASAVTDPALPQSLPRSCPAIHAEDADEMPNAAPGSFSGAAPAERSSKKRKRKDKKLLKRAALLEQALNGGKPEILYEETLLAVIGVLDEVKKQANVAAWIRSGGLWGPLGPSVARSSDVEDVPAEPVNVFAPSSLAHAEKPSDGSDLSADESRAVTSASIQPGSRRDRKREKKRRRTDGDGVVGNDEDTVVPASSSTHADVDVAPQKMWFEHSEVLAYWTSRGCGALDELGIPLEHGIER